MVRQRARTIISTPLPEKPKPVKPERPLADVTGWRSRPTAPGFSDVIEPSFYGTEDEVRERAEVDEMTGAAPVVEQLRGAVYGRPPREVPTVLELAQNGMAREVTYTTRGEDGRDKVSTRWEISPTGQDVLNDAMVGRDE